MSKCYVVKDNEGNIEGIFLHYTDAWSFYTKERKYPVCLEEHELL